MHTEGVEIVLADAGVNRLGGGGQEEWLIRAIRARADDRKAPRVVLTALPAIQPVALDPPYATVFVPRVGTPRAVVHETATACHPAALRIIGYGIMDVPAENPPAGAAGGTDGRFSRLIGALGERTWQQVAGLRYALITTTTLAQIAPFSHIWHSPG